MRIKFKCRYLMSFVPRKAFNEQDATEFAPASCGHAFLVRENQGFLSIWGTVAYSVMACDFPERNGAYD